jgi:hypothetical protein
MPLIYRYLVAGGSSQAAVHPAASRTAPRGHRHEMPRRGLHPLSGPPRPSNTPSTTATSSSLPAAVSASTERKSTSPPSRPDSGSASGRSTREFASSPLSTMIWAISTWSSGPCNPSTTPSGPGCHLCHRYVLLPMSPGRTPVSPGRTREIWSGRRDLNPRPSRWQRDALPLSYTRVHRPVYAAKP